MNESEWAVSEDPLAVLACLSALDANAKAAGHRPQQGSDRKLRLFVNAAARPAYTQVILGTEDEDYEQYGEKDWPNIARQWASYETPGDNAEKIRRANLLREVVGNPFRPVTLPKVLTPAPPPAAPGHCTVHCPWLTPTVLALAQAAYDERGRGCSRCRGEGRIPAYSGMFRLGSGPCPDCHGTGRTGDGHLDPFRLALLSDALEEAGCDNVELLMHLRGLERCPECVGIEYVVGELNCHGEQAQSVIHWRPLPGPHVRGCWALDLVMGKG